MKLSALLLIFSCWCNLLIGQGYGKLNFENNYFSNTAFILDSSSTWIIGRPNKVLFDSAYSNPNAIFTDSSLSYKVNDTSSFILSIKNWGCTNCFDGVPHMRFTHKYDTESTKDGGFIQISYDNGNSWNNILNDTIFNSNPNPGFWPVGYQNMYNRDDTLFNGEPAFSGNSNGWQKSSFRGDGCWYDWLIDSILFKFVFISDSVQTSHEGWLIDDISFGADLCETIEENQIKLLKYYPNPITNELKLDFYKFDEYQIEVITLDGKILKEFLLSNNSVLLDFSGFKTGYYYVRVTSSRINKTFKVYKQ